MGKFNFVEIELGDCCFFGNLLFLCCGFVLVLVELNWVAVSFMWVFFVLEELNWVVVMIVWKILNFSSFTSFDN